MVCENSSINMGERTCDVYEHVSGYPKAPLVPLPDPNDRNAYLEFGLKEGVTARFIANSAMRLSGLRSFQKKQLSQNLEALLRRTDQRGSYLFAPVVSATLALKDDPRPMTPLKRAATLILAARDLYTAIIEGTLTPDRHGEQALEMGQYPNLFSTCLIVDGKRPRIFKSRNISHIAVLIGRQLFYLEIGDLNVKPTIAQLEATLDSLVRRVCANPLKAGDPAPGILTCADHLTQRNIFRRMQSNAMNAESLMAIRHSFLVLCLDLGSYPANYGDAAFLGHSGNCANRWFQSSLQLVVFGNSKADVICNFSTYLDGNTMMRAASELQKRAEAVPIESEAGAMPLPDTKLLKWQIRSQATQKAWGELRATQDNQQATFEIPGFGKKEFLKLDFGGVPTFILALQMTANRFTGRVVKISQFLTMSKYRCMDLDTAIVTTPEVIRFVNMIDQNSISKDEACRQIREAIKSQALACRTAREHLCMGDILTLFTRSRKGAGRSYSLFLLYLAFFLLRILKQTKSSGPREVIVSHPEIYPQVPVVGRPGIRLPYVKYFGLHYQIWEDRIVVTMMPGTRWHIPNAEFIAELERSLKRIVNLIRGAEDE